MTQTKLNWMEGLKDGAPGLEKLAGVVLCLTYGDMMMLCGSLIDLAQGREWSALNEPDTMADLLYLWAEGQVEASA